MPLRRTNEGWRTSSNQRNKWEVENKIIIVGIGKVSEDAKQHVADYIRMLMGELGFDFKVEVAGKDDQVTRCANGILLGSSSQGAIDDESFMGELNKRRAGDATLRAAIVMTVNPQEYRFTDPDAIYGVGYEDGLVILRETREEAVRHEIGHMLGMHSHCKNPNCVMKWECPSKRFCKSCKANLKALWSRVDPE